MSSKFSIYKDMAMLADIAYETIEVNDPTKNGYTVRQNSPANFSGFAATLYQKGDEIVLAIRGTEVGVDKLRQMYYDVIVADVAELGTNSIPKSQVTDMIKFIDELKDSSNLVSKNSKVTIVGHSLGGALAQIASKMYPGLFDKCYTFNSPSGKELNSKKVYKDPEGKYFWIGSEQVNFKHYLDDAIGQAFYNYQNSPMTTLVTDVRAKDFISPIANLYGGERFGELIKVSGETHYITPMTKILYFYDEMIKNGVNEKDITAYLSGFYQIPSKIFDNKKSVEHIANKTLNAINKIVNGDNTKQKDIIDIAIDFEKNNTKFSIEFIFSNGFNQSTFPNSSIPISALYALVHLNPFIVSGVDSPAYKELEQYKDEYSDNYIQDRIKMFNHFMHNVTDVGSYFYDMQSGVSHGITDGANHGTSDNTNPYIHEITNQFIFGTNQNDVIKDAVALLDDNVKTRVYSLAGDDNIKIVGGSAYIEAGSGNDTIDLRSSKGENTVYGGVNNGKDSDDDGDDTIYAGQEKDTIYGGDGHDAYKGIIVYSSKLAAQI